MEINSSQKKTEKIFFTDFFLKRIHENKKYIE